ncbi:MAG: DUF1552 domain-containing protein [Gemmatimonadota bacterium]|nr:DUF1552 domain-containing protein [Gemmatimonadota bacterium]
MTFIGKQMPRRTFLRGMGATVALPMLDAMVPARNLVRLGNAVDPTRLICIEAVHGAAGCSPYGSTQHYWSPAATGSAFDLTPSALLPMEPWRKYMTIVSNTDVRMAEAYKSEEIGGDHFRSSAVFLTQAHPTQTESSDIFVGTSLDQLHAQRFGQATPIPSMQLCIEPVDRAGGCAYGYSCVYTDTISWASPTEPLPMIRDPRVAFDQMFGAGGTSAERAARRKTTGSILDFITDRVAALRRELGAVDRERMEQYLENVREIERRIQAVEARNSTGEVRELAGAPAGVPDSYEEHIKLMFDLQVLAFEADMTRVFSLKTGRDASGRVFPESGVSAGFHNASHHGNNAKRVTEYYQINKYHVAMLPYLMERLKNTMDGGTPLLDKTMIIYGSPMADSNVHNHRRAPLVVLGGANGQLKGNLHVKAADGTPMANAMLTLLHKLGHDDMQTFGDSAGEMAL